MTALEHRVSINERDCGVMAVKLDGFAPVKWVTETIQPIREAILRMEGAQSHLTERMDELLELHEQLLKSRAEQERELQAAKLAAIEEKRASQLKESEEKQFWNVIKRKWALALSVVIAAFTVWEILARAFSALIRAAQVK